MISGPESARAQLSLRLAKLLRLSGEGRRDGELGVPEIVVAEVGMSSMADEEEDSVWVVSTDIWTVAREMGVNVNGQGGQRG
jgi:hypothetical protein